ADGARRVCSFKPFFELLVCFHVTPLPANVSPRRTATGLCHSCFAPSKRTSLGKPQLSAPGLNQPRVEFDRSLLTTGTDNANARADTGCMTSFLNRASEFCSEGHFSQKK